MTRMFDSLARTLVIVGALNWGLVALAKFDLVAAIFGLDFGETNALTRIIYGLVGLSAVWLVGRAAVSRPATISQAPARRAA